LTLTIFASVARAASSADGAVCGE